jgi:hypothetical protein
MIIWKGRRGSVRLFQSKEMTSGFGGVSLEMGEVPRFPEEYEVTRST